VCSSENIARQLMLNNIKFNNQVEVFKVPFTRYRRMNTKAIWLRDPGQDLQESAFARSITANNAHHRAVFEFEGNIFEGQILSLF
jgi:hypothetical protein